MDGQCRCWAGSRCLDAHILASNITVSHNNDFVAALRRVTQAPVVNLPTFNGKISEFAGFKK